MLAQIPVSVGVRPMCKGVICTASKLVVVGLLPCNRWAASVSVFGGPGTVVMPCMTCGLLSVCSSDALDFVSSATTASIEWPSSRVLPVI